MPIVILGMLCWVLAQPALLSAEETFGSPIELTGEIQTTLLNWLDCEECTYDQLKSVVRLGPGVVPFLAVALERGPSPVKFVRLARFLRQSYGELREYQQSHHNTSLPLSERSYIQVHLSHLVTQYQIRAATALGAIGGPFATQALQRAVDREQPEVVRLAVQDALKPRNR